MAPSAKEPSEANEAPALRRVRKLLALANSPNPHEAAVAAARAQALIEQHRLQAWIEADTRAKDPSAGIVDARDEPLERSKRLRKWKIALASVLAAHNGCFAYVLDDKQSRAIVLVGTASDRAAVAELYTWLSKRIAWLSATHGKGQARSWHKAFRLGVISAVGERLQAARTSAHQDLSEAALAVVDPAEAAHRHALDQFVQDRIKLRQGRSIRVDAEAWQAGRAASEDLELP